jgi:tetrahydromethanopterin S-methyltransferase subunit C
LEYNISPFKIVNSTIESGEISLIFLITTMAKFLHDNSCQFSFNGQKRWKLTTLTNIFDVSVMGETDPPSCYL